MLFKTGQPKLIENDRTHQRGRQRYACKHHRSHFFRQRKPGYRRADAEQSASPSPPGKTSRKSVAGPGVPDDQLDGKHTDESAGVDEEPRPHRARQAFIELGVGTRLHRIGRAGSQGEDIREDVLTLIVNGFPSCRFVPGNNPLRHDVLPPWRVGGRI
jgi:hypothetical protein